MRRWLAVAAALLPTLAAAAEQPVTQPTRDVDVTYRTVVDGKPVEQRTRSLAGAAEVRIDTPSPGFYMILDRNARTMDMVSDSDRGAVRMPFDPSRVAGAADGASFRRLGTDTVVGLPCTEWATADNAGREVAACFTADGVFLRARAGAAVLVQATSVTYGKLDPTIFAIPPGYGRVTAPARR